jgi:hypothetical protein
MKIEYGVTWHADLKEWVAELQDEEDEMHANVLTPTNINHHYQQQRDRHYHHHHPSPFRTLPLKPSSSNLKPNNPNLHALQKMGRRRCG